MLIAGNWKMYKSGPETLEFARALRDRLESLDGVDVVVCPPYTSLAQAVSILAPTPIAVFAQNAHWAREGAYTGEISPPMLHELGVTGSLVGHSERRQLFGETDDGARRRIEGLLAAGLHVVACVGETEDEHEAGETESVLRRQVAAVRSAVDEDSLERLAIAYEPVWAIGTGRTASPEQAQDAHALIRDMIDVPILYGGSVKPENVEQLLAQRDIDGALVGGASLDLESFAAICESASRLTSA